MDLGLAEAKMPAGPKGRQVRAIPRLAAEGVVRDE